MTQIEFGQGELKPEYQQILIDGFSLHSDQVHAPQFDKSHVHWLAFRNDGELGGALTADLLWDWLYIDELWVSKALRGKGLGRQLIAKAEDYAATQGLCGIWLWTQSWQAEELYTRVGFTEFARFPNFPRGYERIGYSLSSNSDTS